MNKLILMLLIVVLSGCSATPKGCDGVLSIGAGYKLFQTKSHYLNEYNELTKRHNSGVSGRLNLGMECEKIRTGYEHRSDVFNGRPFNDNLDTTTDEIYIDYVIRF